MPHTVPISTRRLSEDGLICAEGFHGFDGGGRSCGYDAGEDAYGDHADGYACKQAKILCGVNLYDGREYLFRSQCEQPANGCAAEDEQSDAAQNLHHEIGRAHI